MKHIPVLALFVFLVISVGCAEDTSALIGIYSNKAEGFYIKTIFLDVDGKGLYFAGVGGAPVLWEKSGNIISLTGPLGENQKDATIKTRYDPSKKTLEILDPKYAEAHGLLQFVPDKIPAQLHEKLKKFDGSLKSLQR